MVNTSTFLAAVQKTSLKRLNIEFSIKHNLIYNEVNNYQYQLYSKFKFNITTFNGVFENSYS